MIANMVSCLFAHERVNTTDARGRVLRRTAERIITFAKRGDLHARRQVLRQIPDKSIVAKLFDEIAPRYAERHGGYTRLVKTGARRGGRRRDVHRRASRPPRRRCARGRR